MYSGGLCHGYPKVLGTYSETLRWNVYIRLFELTDSGFISWLIAKGRVQEAEIILADLEALDVDDPYIVTQSKDIQWAVNYERENNIPWSMLLRGKTGPNQGTSTIRRMILGMGTQAMQQFRSVPSSLPLSHNNSSFD